MSEQAGKSPSPEARKIAEPPSRSRYESLRALTLSMTPEERVVINALADCKPGGSVVFLGDCGEKELLLLREFGRERERAAYERAAKAVCPYCAEGVPFNDCGCDFYPKPEHRRSDAQHLPCAASAIRALLGGE